jgi:hypothetical protein
MSEYACGVHNVHYTICSRLILCPILIFSEQVHTIHEILCSIHFQPFTLLSIVGRASMTKVAEVDNVALVIQS